MLISLARAATRKGPGPFSPNPILLAPTRRQIVAAGGAARSLGDPTRNPWKADEGESFLLYSSFAPAGRRRFFGLPKGRPCPTIPPPLKGRMSRNTNTPTGCATPKRHLFTRGYIPPPRWGEQRRFQVSGFKFQVQRLPAPGRLQVPHECRAPPLEGVTPTSRSGLESSRHWPFLA